METIVRGKATMTRKEITVAPITICPSALRGTNGGFPVSVTRVANRILGIDC